MDQYQTNPLQILGTVSAPVTLTDDYADNLWQTSVKDLHGLHIDFGYTPKAGEEDRYLYIRIRLSDDNGVTWRERTLTEETITGSKIHESIPFLFPGSLHSAGSTNYTGYIDQEILGDLIEISFKESGAADFGTANASVILSEDYKGGSGGGISSGSSSGSSSASGGSAGGGNNTYSTEQGDFTAIITDATNNVVLSTDSLAGSAITEANLANGILKVWDASTEEMVTITLNDFTWTPGTKTIDTSGCTGAFTFATGDVVSLTLLGARIQDNRSADAKKNIEQAPIYTHNIGDTLAEVTNETNATNNYYLDVSSYDELYFDFEGVAGTDTITLTLEASVQDDGTVDSSCSYTDISQYGISPTTQAAGAASYTADLSGEIDCKGKKYIKFKTVSSGGSDDGGYNLRVGRAY